jgi:hypothetical protein
MMLEEETKTNSKNLYLQAAICNLQAASCKLQAEK